MRLSSGTLCLLKEAIIFNFTASVWVIVVKRNLHICTYMCDIIQQFYIDK